RRRRLLGVTAGSAAAIAAIVLAGRSGAIARADEDQALVGSWMVAGIPTGASPGPPRILVSFTGDGVAIRTAPLQQAAPPALGSDKMFISTTHGAWVRMDDGGVRHDLGRICLRRRWQVPGDAASSRRGATQRHPGRLH